MLSLKELKSTWFGRTIINSGHELFYELAQKIIDGTVNEAQRDSIKNLKQLEIDLIHMRDIARILRVCINFM